MHTEQGDIEADHVVNSGGTYARQVGEWVGLDLPIANMLHHYLITDTVPEFEQLEKELPVIRDDSQVSGYIRMEQKSGLIGIYEKANAASVWDDGTPWESENELFEPDYDRIMPWLENALERMPILADKGIKSVVHGAITHPPDGNMLLGPSGVKEFLALLRFAGRHRLGSGCRQISRAVDGAWRRRRFDAQLRSTSLRRAHRR